MGISQAFCLQESYLGKVNINMHVKLKLESCFSLCQANGESEGERQVAETAGERYGRTLWFLLTCGPGVILTRDTLVSCGAIGIPVAGEQLLALPFNLHL